MTSDDFKLWMKSQGLSVRRAAESLGVEPTTVFDMSRGVRSSGKPVVIDRRTALACAAISVGLDEWKPETDMQKSDD